MLCVSALGMAAETKMKKPVQVITSRMNVFYFKVDKEFLGAELEIYSEDGVKLFSQKITERKVLIDFYYENPGKYNILIRKGEVLEQFTFVKETACLEKDRPSESIPVMQGV